MCFSMVATTAPSKAPMIGAGGREEPTRQCPQILPEQQAGQVSWLSQPVTGQGEVRPARAFKLRTKVLAEKRVFLEMPRQSTPYLLANHFSWSFW